MPGWPRAQMRAFELSAGVDGPTASVVAGLGGTAYAGIEACWRLLDLLKTVKLNGTVRILPVADVAGFLDRSAHFCTLDGGVVIQSFESVEGGAGQGSPEHEASRDSATDAVARSVSAWIAPSDFHIDLRGGELTESHASWVAVLGEGDDQSGLASRAAGACGAMFRLRISPGEGPWIPLGSAGAAAAAGSPSLILSAGGAPFELEQDAQVLFDGVTRVLRQIGVLPGASEPTPVTPHEVGPQSWTHLARQIGQWIAEVEAGQRVEEGQQLGKIWDYFGDTLEEVVAPFSGWIMALNTSVAVDAIARADGDDWYQRTVTVVADA